MDETSVRLYEAVAQDISSMIDAGTLTAGQRIPSVRRLSTQRRISITTVLQAYQLLEDRGVIEARPQSGHYVRSRTRSPEPSLTKPPQVARRVDVDALVQRVLDDRKTHSIIPFGTSIPYDTLVPIARLRRILASVTRRHPEVLAAYSFPPGQEPLRRQIALRLRDWGVRVTADDIVVTNGCSEAVNLCLRAVAKAGNVVALESPTFFGILQVIESLGMKAFEIPTHPQNGISLDALEAAIEKQPIAACILMPTVSNPLGSTMPDAAKKRLVRMLAQHDIPLIEDCVYSALHYGSVTPFACKAYDTQGKVMLCSSFSKTFGPGFRIGWAVPGRHIARVQTLKFVNSMGVSDVLQLAAAEYLASGGYDRLLRKLRTTYARQVAIVSEAVLRAFPPKTQVTRPSGGFILWVVLPRGVDTVELYERAVDEGIGIAPGPMFSASLRYRNCLRINCGMPWSGKIERALARIGELARDQLRSPQADRAIHY